MRDPNEVVIKVPHTCLPGLVLSVIHDRHFDHTEWSLWQAECFEKLAKMIRDGYDGRPVDADRNTIDHLDRGLVSIDEARALITKRLYICALVELSDVEGEPPGQVQIDRHDAERMLDMLEAFQPDARVYVVDDPVDCSVYLGRDRTDPTSLKE